MTRIRLQIDQIVTDQPGLDRRAIEQALRAELARLIEQQGAGVLGPGRAQPVIRERLAASRDPAATQIATATLRALTSGGTRP